MEESAHVQVCKDLTKRLEAATPAVTASTKYFKESEYFGEVIVLFVDGEITGSGSSLSE